MAASTETLGRFALPRRGREVAPDLVSFSATSRGFLPICPSAQPPCSTQRCSKACAVTRVYGRRDRPGFPQLAVGPGALSSNVVTSTSVVMKAELGHDDARDPHFGRSRELDVKPDAIVCGHREPPRTGMRSVAEALMRRSGDRAMEAIMRPAAARRSRLGDSGSAVAPPSRAAGVPKGACGRWNMRS